MSLYVDPAVKAQQAKRHDVCIIGRHEKHGYLLLLNCRAEGKEFSEFFAFSSTIQQEEVAMLLMLGFLQGSLSPPGLSLAPSRFKRLYFPAQVQKRLGNKVFLEIALYDHDSLCLGETAMTGEPDFRMQLEETDGFTFHRDLGHTATALRGTSRTMAHALLAMKAVYRDTSCFGGIFTKMAEKLCEMSGWP